jgi:metal-responsive CopG/Arc/MetJ family transcriptional regulator
MKTIQMTFNDELLHEVDRAVKNLKTTRSALIRDSVRHYLQGLTERQLEAKHRAGYLKRPVKRGEFDAWETEHKWGE